MSRLFAVPITPPVRRNLLRLSVYHFVQKKAWVLLFLWTLLLSLHLVFGSSSPAAGPDTQSSMTPVARGIVTITSNLRDAPSTKSGAVGIAKERTPVDIIGQTEHWYHIRTGDGLEAWIYKPLVLIEPATVLQTETVEVSPPTVVEDQQDTPTPEPVGVPEVSQAEASAEEQEQPPDAGELPASQPAPTEPIAAPAEAIAVPVGPNPMLETIFKRLQGLGGYLVAALVVVVIVSIGLQWRAARQLRRAMGEMGQIRDIVEDIYSEVVLPRPSVPQSSPSIPAPPVTATLPTRESGHWSAAYPEAPTVTATLPTRESGHWSAAYPEAPTATATLPTPAMEFSPLERALLEGLSSGKEVQEGELANILQERGFPGVLIKAVIGAIVRKTAGDGRPWVEVKYTHGRYAYALRPPGGTRGRGARQGE